MNSPRSRIWSRFLRPATVALLACASLIGQAYAAANTWTGSAFTGNFGDAGNWAAALTGGDTLTFPIRPLASGATVSNLTNNSAISTFAGITFSAGAGNYTINTTGSTSFGTISGASATATARGGDYTFHSAYGGSGTTTLTLAFSAANYNIGDGNILVLHPSGGTTSTFGNAGNNKIVLTGAQAGFLRSRDFFDTDTTADFAFNDAGGFIRAPVYGSGTGDGGTTDVGFINDSTGAALTSTSHYLVTTSISNQGNLFTDYGVATPVLNGATTIKFSGAGAVDVTQLAGTTLQLGTGAGNLGGGILRDGGGSTTISGGTLQFGSGLLWYIRTVSPADTLIINSAMGPTNSPTSVNNFVKNGAGTVVIGSTDSLTGPTWVNEGTLLVNGTHATGNTYTINNGATLGGIGAIALAAQVNAPATVQVNGTLAPGDSLAAQAGQTGVLDITGILTLNTGADVAIQIGGNTPGDGVGHYDQVNVLSGAINLSSGVSLSLSLVNGFSPSDTDKFFILTRKDNTSFTNTFLNTDDGGSVDLGNGFQGTISYFGDVTAGTVVNGKDVVIYNVVPEPDSFALAAFGLLGTMILLRKRSRRFGAE